MHTFTNLASGWYAIKTKSTLNPTCLSFSYIYVDYDQAVSACEDDVNIDFAIYDCGAWQANVAVLGTVATNYYTINGVAPAEQNQSQIVSENDVITFTVIFGEETNCTPYIESYTVGAINCPPPPPVEILGCTDVTASNYNPLANVARS